ncbi:MAG: nuclease-related domain-containing protein [Phototrophicaceae bacterium]
MRIVTNHKLVKRNRQIATWLFLGTLAILVGGFILINYSFFTGNTPADWILLAQVVALPIVFVLTVYSVRMTNLWAREPYPHDAIEAGLKGLSKRSIMYNYYHLPARHILIAPQGVFAIATRWHDGKFTVEGDKWQSQKGTMSRFFSAMRMDGVGTPVAEAQKAAEHVQSLLADIAPDIEVKPLVVFVNDDIELDIQEDPSIDVLYTNEKKTPNLSEFMREINRQIKSDPQQKAVLPLTDEQIEAFEKATLKK